LRCFHAWNRSRQSAEQYFTPRLEAENDMPQCWHVDSIILLTPNLIDRPADHFRFGDAELGGLGSDPFVLGCGENDLALDSGNHV